MEATTIGNAAILCCQSLNSRNEAGKCPTQYSRLAIDNAGAYGMQQTARCRAAFENMNRAITVSNVRPVIDRTFTFSEARNALAYLENGGQFGKIVIRVS